MEDGIRQSTEALAEALARRDAVAAAALYAERCRLLTPAAELVAGRQEVEAYWRAGICVGLARIELAPLEIEARGELAVEIGRYELALEQDGAAPGDRGKYLALHRLQPDGTWRRVVDVFNPDVPQPARRTTKEER